MERADPMRVTMRVETEDPTCTKSRTEAHSPNRAKARRLNEEPRLTQFSVEVASWIRAHENNEIAEPMRENPRIDIAEP
jgi:hypothetical protein